MNPHLSLFVYYPQYLKWLFLSKARNVLDSSMQMCALSYVAVTNLRKVIELPLNICAVKVDVFLKGKKKNTFKHVNRLTNLLSKMKPPKNLKIDANLQSPMQTLVLKL